MKFDLGNPYMRSREVEVNTAVRNNRTISNIVDGYNEDKAIARIQKERFLEYSVDAKKAIEAARKAKKEPTALEFLDTANKRRMEQVNAQRELDQMYSYDPIQQSMDIIHAGNKLGWLREKRMEQSRQGYETGQMGKEDVNIHTGYPLTKSELAYFEPPKYQKPIKFGHNLLTKEKIPLEEMMKAIPSQKYMSGNQRNVYEMLAEDPAYLNTLHQIQQRTISGKNYRLNNPIINTALEEKALAQEEHTQDLQTAEMKSLSQRGYETGQMGREDINQTINPHRNTKSKTKPKKMLLPDAQKTIYHLYRNVAGSEQANKKIRDQMNKIFNMYGTLAIADKDMAMVIADTPALMKSEKIKVVVNEALNKYGIKPKVEIIDRSAYL
jgi:hypothetical protein